MLAGLLANIPHGVRPGGARRQHIPVVDLDDEDGFYKFGAHTRERTAPEIIHALAPAQPETPRDAIDEIFDEVYSVVNQTTKVERPRQLEALVPFGPAPVADASGSIGPAIEPARTLPTDIGFEDDEEAILVILLGD